MPCEYVFHACMHASYTMSARLHSKTGLAWDDELKCMYNNFACSRNQVRTLKDQDRAHMHEWAASRILIEILHCPCLQRCK